MEMHGTGRGFNIDSFRCLASSSATLSLSGLQDLDVNGKGKVTVDQVLGWTHHRHVLDGTFCWTFESN